MHFLYGRAGTTARHTTHGTRGGMHCKTEHGSSTSRSQTPVQKHLGRINALFAMLPFRHLLLSLHNTRHLACRHTTNKGISICSLRPAWKPPGAIHSGLGVHTLSAACGTDSGYGSIEVMRAGRTTMALASRDADWTPLTGSGHQRQTDLGISQTSAVSGLRCLILI